MPDSGAVILWLWNDISELSLEQIEQARQLLSSSEKTYLGTIKAKARRLEYIAGHHLIRQVVEYLVPEWASDTTVEHRRGEAPSLRGPNAERITFNLSHSGNSVCCAMALDCQLGLDIERPRRRRKYRQIAEAYFSPTEAEQIAELPFADQEAVFYRFWTLKESLLKARREGLSSDNLAMAFRREEKISDATWHCFSFKVDQSYFALSLSRPLSEPLSIQAYDLGTGVSCVIQPQTHCYVPEC